MSTAERVLSILVTVAETDEVRQDPNVQLYELDLLDSLKTVELLVALSEEFGVELSPAEFEREHWATPRQIVAYMQGRVGE
jgi:D-alanine--poly(phosphoribitol) ligase subunit 2